MSDHSYRRLIAGLSWSMVIIASLPSCNDDPIASRAGLARSVGVPVDDGNKCLHPAYAVVSIGPLILRTHPIKVVDGSVSITPLETRQWRLPPAKPLDTDHGSSTDVYPCQIDPLPQARDVYLKYRSDRYGTLPPMDYLSAARRRNHRSYETPYELHDLTSDLDVSAVASSQLSLQTENDAALGRREHTAYTYSSPSGKRFATCYKANSPHKHEGVLSYCTVLFLHKGVAVEASAHAAHGTPVSVPRLYRDAQRVLRSMIVKS